MHSRYRIGTSVAVLWFCCGWIDLGFASDSAAVEGSLSKAVDIEFTNTPLDEVLSDLSRRSQIPIVTDQRSLHPADVQLHNISITHRASQVPFGKALEDILNPHQLVWVMRHDVVLVTTATAAAEDYYDTRVYKVTRRVPVERRMRSIMWSVAPTSWVTAGGTGDAAPLPPNLILVYQSPLRHRQIAGSFAESVVPVRARPTRSPTGLEGKLAAPTTIECESMPLLDALEQLENKHAVTISIDKQAFDDGGISMDDLIVTLRVGQIRTLASGLSLLLETTDRELEWIVDEDAILITTATAAETRMFRWTYDVQKFLPDGGVEQLIEAIQYTVASFSWEDVGGDAKIKAVNENATLEVLQSYPVHRTLRQIFADLQAGLADETK